MIHHIILSAGRVQGGAPPRSSTQIGEVIARPELPSGSSVHSLDVPGTRLYCDGSRNDFSTGPTLPVLRAAGFGTPSLRRIIGHVHAGRLLATGPWG